MRKLVAFCGWIFFGLVVPGLLFGTFVVLPSFIVYRDVVFAQNAVSVEATVVGYERGWSLGEQLGSVDLVVSFQTVDGQNYEVEMDGSREVGDRLPVLYLPDSPDEVRVDSFWGKWSGSLMVGLFAVTIFGVGLLIMMDHVDSHPLAEKFVDGVMVTLMFFESIGGPIILVIILLLLVFGIW